MADRIWTTEAEDQVGRNICGCDNCRPNRTRPFALCLKADKIAQLAARGNCKAVEAKVEGLERAAEILSEQECGDYYHFACGCEVEAADDMRREAKALRDAAEEA